MWIRILNPATGALYNEDFMDEKVEFNNNGTANVSEDLGEALIENYSTVIEYNKGE